MPAAAVATLAEPYGVDADELFRKTAGNPFFVTEALAAGEGQIPPTVRDAVLARAAHLGPRATALLEAIAVVPQQAELWLVEALADDGVDRLEECASSGVLRAERQSVSFRHELARLAIEESLAPNRRVTLNRKALTALADPPTGAPDFARLAHHAEAAANAVAVLQFAPAAAERAASLGAHREAAGQWARALRFADGVDAYALGELLDRHTYECYLTDEFEEAIKSGGRAIECYRKVGQQRKEGNALWSLSRVLWCACRNAQAEEAGHEAIALLEQIPPGRELAMAYSNLSQIRMNKEDREGTVAWGTRAIELAGAPRRARDTLRSTHQYRCDRVPVGSFGGEAEARTKPRTGTECGARGYRRAHVQCSRLGGNPPPLVRGRQPLSRGRPRLLQRPRVRYLAALPACTARTLRPRPGPLDGGSRFR